MPDTDHYADFEDDERAISALTWTVSGVGVLAFLGRTLRTRSRPSSLTIRSRWWKSAWRDFERRLIERLSGVGIDAIARAARLVRWDGPLPDQVAADAAQDFARIAVKKLRKKTEAGYLASLAEFRKQKRPRAHLARFLADRLGATPKQLARIHKWERAQIEAGEMSARAIRRKVRARRASAARIRANAFASAAIVREVSAAEMAVYAAVGVDVWSSNPRDERSDAEHARQANLTEADPRPAGSGWTAAAPFRGLPPYPHRGRISGKCRCGVLPAI